MAAVAVAMAGEKDVTLPECNFCITLPPAPPSLYLCAIAVHVAGAREGRPQVKV